MAAESFRRVVIATDSERVLKVARDFGAEAVMTSPNHTSGTSRVAEVARETTDKIVVNIQADEPLVAPALLDRLVRRLDSNDWASVTTPVLPLTERVRFLNPHVVKLVMDGERRIIYFSRAPIPHGLEVDTRSRVCWEHQGVYAYRREVLLRWVELPSSPLEEAEGLEQLRLLEAGYRFCGVISDKKSPGVNTKEDVSLVEELLVAKEQM